MRGWRWPGVVVSLQLLGVVSVLVLKLLSLLGIVVPVADATESLSVVAAAVMWLTLLVEKLPLLELRRL